MCKYCTKDNMVQALTTYTVEYKNCIIVIKNVPCLECPTCGEQYFTDQVSEKIEKIVDAAKSIMTEVSVIDFNSAA